MEKQDNNFKIRGVKGLWWDGAEKYKNIIHWMPEHHFNFLMLCYTSFPGSGMNWRKGYAESERRQIKELAQYGALHGIDLCLSINPGLWPKPELLCSSDEDYQVLLNNYLLMSTAGVKWFALCLDDISRVLPAKDRQKFETLGKAHAYLVNRIYQGLKEKSPEIKFVFCPVTYSTADAKTNLDYAKDIGENTDKEIPFFWTGTEVCSPTITDDDAGEISAIFGHRKILIWDNYPANDYAPKRLFLAPIQGRSKTLYHHVLGLVSNPMKQVEISKLPLATVGDYLWNPENYNSDESITKSVVSLGKTKIDSALKNLVSIYGNHFLGAPKFNKDIVPESKDDALKLAAELKTILSAIKRHREFHVLYHELVPAIKYDLDRLTSYSKRTK